MRGQVVQASKSILADGETVKVLAKDQLQIGDAVYTVVGEPGYISDIYANAGITALSNNAWSVTFSPDGTKLVLGGSFTGRAKIYSVSGTTVTFISDIYADAGITVLSSTVNSVTFSPDGTKLVLGGSFIGYAKIYSVSGTTATYVSDIYADAGTTVLSSSVLSAAFSPDGNKLVLEGNFTGYAKIYNLLSVFQLAPPPLLPSTPFKYGYALEAANINNTASVRVISDIPIPATLDFVGDVQTYYDFLF